MLTWLELMADPSSSCPFVITLHFCVCLGVYGHVLDVFLSVFGYIYIYIYIM